MLLVLHIFLMHSSLKSNLSRGPCSLPAPPLPPPVLHLVTADLCAQSGSSVRPAICDCSGAGLKWTCKLVCKVVYTLSPTASRSDALQQIAGHLRRASYASYVCKVMNFLEIHRSIRMEEKEKKKAK